MLQAAGIGDDMTFATTPEGIVALVFFGKFALFFVAYPVVIGMRVTADEETDGMMDILLSLPVERARVVVEKVAAYLLTMVLLTGVIFVGVWVGAQLIKVPLNTGRLVESTLNLLPTLTFVLAVTVFVGALLGRRSWALGVVTTFVLGSYMLDTIGGMAKESMVGSLRLLSFFNHYNPSGVMQFGLSWPTVMGLLALSVVLFAGGVWAFQRRDIGA
jgi:ABC-2 type transport system permease protein